MTASEHECLYISGQTLSSGLVVVGSLVSSGEIMALIPCQGSASMVKQDR